MSSLLAILTLDNIRVYVSILYDDNVTSYIEALID